MKVGAIVQARMSSRRLPSKVLRDLCGRPVIEYVLQSIRRGGVDQIVVATSNDSSDDAIAHYCEARGLECRRGDLHDVAQRFADSLASLPWDAFLRISADSPLLHPDLVQWARQAICRPECEIATNVFPRTFPRGQSIEAIERSAFDRGLEMMRNDEDREHVTPAFYRNSHRFSIVNLQSPRDFGEIHLALDDVADLAPIEATVRELRGEPWRWRLDQVVRAYRRVASRPARVSEAA